MTRNIYLCALCVCMFTACSKHDPVLPGTRTAIFGNDDLYILNTNISGLDDSVIISQNVDCPYTQDGSNTIKDDDNNKIFVGFPATNFVNGNQKPICYNGDVYAGLTTGNVVKIDSKTKRLLWITDVYKPNNMTGGSSVVDIVAPMVINNNVLYVGGMGDAFCKVNISNGVAKWCTDIGTVNEFIVTTKAIFVVGTDNYLYALRNLDGAIYWRSTLKKQCAPQYKDKIITVCKEKINAETGEKIK